MVINQLEIQKNQLALQIVTTTRQLQVLNEQYDATLNCIYGTTLVNAEAPEETTPSDTMGSAEDASETPVEPVVKPGVIEEAEMTYGDWVAANARVDKANSPEPKPLGATTYEEWLGTGVEVSYGEWAAAVKAYAIKNSPN